MTHTTPVRIRRKSEARKKRSAGSSFASKLGLTVAMANLQNSTRPKQCDFLERERITLGEAFFLEGSRCSRCDFPCEIGNGEMRCVFERKDSSTMNLGQLCDQGEEWTDGDLAIGHGVAHERQWQKV